MPTLPALPSDADLRRQIQFSAADGRIWLAGQRMVLMHAASLGILRRELMHTLGPTAARRLLLRVGYASGERDAALARQLRPGADAFAMFSVGPQLHMLQGAVQVAPRRLELDMASGHFHGIFDWQHSWEVETHVRDFGAQHNAVCWTLLGYASGYTSAFMGRTVLYKEVQCAACGHAHCRIEGRPVQDWPDGAQVASDYAPDALALPEGARTPVAWPPPVPAEDRPEPPADALGQLIGRSTGFNAATQLLRKAASTQVTVLLTGETGVGKERCRAAWSSRNCLAPRKAPTPAPTPRAPGASSAPTAARCSWTSWASCRCQPRPSSCACCRTARWSAWARPSRARWMCAWWRPRTRIWPRRCAPGAFARICTTA
jgi:hypothetical protein